MQHFLMDFIIIMAGLIRTALGKAIRILRREVRKLFKGHWPEVPAWIEIISVYEIPEPSRFIKSYVGTLTYFYRDPDLRTGDYAAEFGSQKQAQAWVQPFKGRRVTVRVNPKDPEDSVLLQLPLDPAFRPRAYVPPVTPVVSPKREKQVIKAEVLTDAQRTLAEYSRLVSIAGLAASLVVLSLSLVSGGLTHSATIFWLGGALLALLVASAGELSFRIARRHTLRTLVQFYAGWSPALARTLLTAFALILIAVSLLIIDLMQIPSQSRDMIGAHLPYFAGVWAFLTSWVMLTAILRSQRNAGTP